MAELKETKQKAKAKPQPKAQPKVIFTTGKRKRAVARATLKPGSGVVKINYKPIEAMPNEMLRLKMQEPLILVGDDYRKFDINVAVRGGGVLGQAEAARQAIARGLVAALGEDVKRAFLSYDRNLLAYDPRRTEPHKPPRSSQGPRRYKQRSKR